MVDLVDRYVAWAKSRPGVVAVALIGSHARGDERRGSDVDVLTLLDDPADLTSDTGWIETFGRVESVGVETWGAVTSLRVYYRGGPEVEFGLTTREWAAIDPVDPGTERIVSDGMRILHDPFGLLARLASRLQ